MSDSSTIVDVIRDRQKAMRRQMDERHISLKVVAYDSGVEHKTLLTYFPADPLKVPAQIPGSVIFALTGHIPADILSLLLPAGHLVVRVPEAVDHDEIAEALQDYLCEKERAHREDSPAGRDIAPCEDDTLRSKFAVVVGGRA